MNFFTYDLETYRNCFLFAGRYHGGQQVIYEVSDRLDDRAPILHILSHLQNAGYHMVGYNNLNFDYPIIHELLTNPHQFTALKAWELAQTIISQQYGRFMGSIRLSERILPQIDLMKINHFDNPMKRTRLKDIQFAMRLPSVEDLPFDPNLILTHDQMNMLRSYCLHDVDATDGFLVKCMPMIQMRKDLLDHGVLTGDVLNYSDVKLGTEYLVSKIGRAKCYIGQGKPRTTPRSSVQFRDIILDGVQFETQAFKNVLEWFKAQTIFLGRSDRPKLSALLGNLEFDFGVGGVHASVESRKFISTDSHIIRDVDVGGMYPSIAVANGFAPEHLRDSFALAYRQLQADRKQYIKGTMMNLVLKLANNGVFGNSNNEYSPFFDPKFTFSITINGQLQLLQLAERFTLIPGIQLIQANTDGITALVPRSSEAFFYEWCAEWEQVTGLKLEHATFDRMFIRDVNNYIAVTDQGKVKRKGAYWYPITDDDYHGSSGSNWNKDFSNLTAQKGAEACMLHGHSAADIIRTFSDPFDFMLRYKTPSGAKVFIGDKEQLRTVRYYVSTSGEPMKKIAAPKGIIGQFKRKNGIKDEVYEAIKHEVGPDTWDIRIHTKNKSRYEAVETSVESGYLVKCCNRASDFNWADLDFSYYIKEIEKLLIGGENAPHIL